ncbi:glycerate kinase [Inhella sp.]|uniref:glycerate kinase type-2 family protein n=1 Tax=Inhella sp. TaxID=1921806 RepID=UPI0035B28CC8
MRALPQRLLLRRLFDAAVARAQPSAVLAAHLPAPPRGRTLVLGAGKASAAMAAALEAAWPACAPLEGVVITRHGHTPPSYAAQQAAGLARIRVLEAGHPVPDAAGLTATQQLMAATRGLTANDLVIALISGGGSALLAAPLPGIQLTEWQAVQRALLLSGASIHEMNVVRKHLSAVHGGRLALHCHPARLLSLLISDVPGDDPGVIASGPTLPDPSTCADALRLCARLGVALPAAARAGLEGGAFESPKPDHPAFSNSDLRLVATPRASLQAAAERAREEGLTVHLLGDDLEGESREVAKVHAALARSVLRHGEPFASPCVLLSGGETTVSVTPGSACGCGGRAAEFALSLAISLAGHRGVHGLAADTDGIDGLSEHAGAFIDPDTLIRAQALGLQAPDFLQRHDAARFFEALGDTLSTGPTHTNVNDFRALWIGSS